MCDRPLLIGTGAAARASAKAQRMAMLGVIRDLHMHGATADDIEAVLDVGHHAVVTRVGELVKAGLVINSGRTRSTRAGRKAAVYLAKGDRDA